MLYFSSLHFVPYKVLNAKPENVDREGEVVGQVCACVKGTEEEEKRRMGGDTTLIIELSLLIHTPFYCTIPSYSIQKNPAPPH